MKRSYTLLFALGSIIILLATHGCGRGHPGDTGAPGKPCTVTKAGSVSTIRCEDGTEVEVPDGENGISGPIGATGAPGPAGANGADGTNGVNGQPGAPGVNATPVTSVQFCSGVTVYPSFFAEVGLCISGKLYAVYWDHYNSWLTEVPPGSYSSTSTSVPCSFTVTANCGVSH